MKKMTPRSIFMINYYQHINLLSDDRINGMEKLSCLFNRFEYLDDLIENIQSGEDNTDDDLDEIMDHKSIPLVELQGFDLDAI